MKRTSLLTIALASAVLFSCNQADNTKKEAESAQSGNAAAEKVEWVIDTENSVVNWKGGTSGAMVYSHYGTIDIKEGRLTSEGDKITAGMVVIDMTTINPTDDGYSEEHPKEDLIAHLSSPDFFDVANHPVSTFEITGTEGNVVKGNLTIRGITHPEEVELSDMKIGEDGTLHAKGKLVFDRQQFNVSWKHYMQDVILSDDIILEFDLKANKAN
ncbi:MAG: hypothetical protein Kow0075_13290 [Salibacteraceae bacterium]